MDSDLALDCPSCLNAWAILYYIGPGWPVHLRFNMFIAAVGEGLIKPMKEDAAPRNMRYVPFWA